MTVLWQDIKYGLRMLRKSHGFTAVAVISLALGIGATTAIFSLVNAILLGSLPVPDPQELRVIRWSGTETRIQGINGIIRDTANGRRLADSFAYPQYRSLRERTAAQADIFAFGDGIGGYARARHEPFMAEGLMVSDNFFSGLGVRPLLGRVFGMGDDDPDTPPIIVISYAWWERQFDLDPDVLGQSVTLNSSAFTVVGVLPREFRGVGLADAREFNEFYVPMSAQPLLRPSWSTTSFDYLWVHLMARVKPGVSSEQLQAALDVAFAPQAASMMKTPKIEVGDGRAGPAYREQNYRKPLLLLLSVAGVVILVVCANLAGLSLARGAARQHEFAVRASFGSSRWRLIRQSLTENLLLALLGGGFGLLLASWGKTVVSRLLAGSPEGLRYDLSLDLRVLVFTLAVTLVTAVLSGLLPAWRAGQVDPVEDLKSKGSTGTPRLRAGRALVTAQVAFSVLLLGGAGLYARTLINLVHINPGFRTENLLLFVLRPYAAGLRAAATTRFYESVQDSLNNLPGVRSAALTGGKLLSGMENYGSFFSLPAHPERASDQMGAHWLTVSETFFSTMGIPILLGRGFAAPDTEGAPKVIVVNETFAREYFANEYAVGQILKQGDGDWEIVGVCRDAKHTSIKDEVPPTVYYSFRQSEAYDAYFAIRTALPPLSLVPAVRKAVAAINPNVPLSDVTTQKMVLDKSISQETMFAMLVGALAGLAVLLTCIGLYGLMACNVARRTSEIGIRMALGATRTDVAWPILREVILLVSVGLAIGLPVALALTRFIESQLYGVAPADPITFVAGGGMLMMVALLSAWVPARRAARIDPMVALRCE
ncbi:MAG: ABC transporter permease [Phycisphaerales bacterium]